MAVSGVSSGYDVAPSGAEETSSKGNSKLGKSDFLNLLVTQLRYQDPLSPAEDTEFIAQMAQFSSLEQMQNLNDSFSKFKAFSLVGKNVTADYETESIEGYVESVRMVDGVAYAVVDGKSVEVDKIKKVTDIAEELQVLVGILEQLKNSGAILKDDKTETDVEVGSETVTNTEPEADEKTESIEGTDGE